MAAINFEALTVLGGEFVNFDEIREETAVLMINGDAEGGLYIYGRGTGDQLWCDYDFNEWHLKFGRIALMKVGEKWIERHNNWYGSMQVVTLLNKEELEDDTILTLMWEKYTDKMNGEHYEEVLTVVVSIENEQINEYYTKHNYLHHFVYEMNAIEEMITYPIDEEEDIDILLEEEIIEEIE